MSLDAYNRALDDHRRAVESGDDLAREIARNDARNAWNAYAADAPRRSIPRNVISPIIGPTDPADAGHTSPVARPFAGVPHDRERDHSRIGARPDIRPDHRCSGARDHRPRLPDRSRVPIRETFETTFEGRSRRFAPTVGQPSRSRHIAF